MAGGRFDLPKAFATGYIIATRLGIAILSPAPIFGLDPF